MKLLNQHKSCHSLTLLGGLVMSILAAFVMFIVITWTNSLSTAVPLNNQGYVRVVPSDETPWKEARHARD